ncbi:MAG: 2-hydroxyacyl-CoA dehydratase family protein [Dehalococcoidia bacterium]
MKVPTIDLKPHDRMMEVLEGMYRHRLEHPTSKSDELYYSLLLNYNRRIRDALDKGSFIAGHQILIPPELFFGLDMVPMLLEFTCGTIVASNKSYEEALSAAKSYGLPPEICSAHRIMAAMFLKGWAPPPNVIMWSNTACENEAKTGGTLAAAYGIPGLFLDRPYHHTEQAEEYLAEELEDMVGRLEELSGHRMDYDRLGQALELSAEMTALAQEIYELRRAVPSPLGNRRAIELWLVAWYSQGTHEAVDYYRQVRDELKAMIDEGRGAAQHEKFRLISVLTAPFHAWKTLDWMEREHGATIVADPDNAHWDNWELDLSRPYLSLARRAFVSPVIKHLNGPMTDMVTDLVEAVKTHQADGAIYFAHVGCRQGCSAIRTIKDTLMEEAGIPTLALDCDFMDPTFVSEEETKDKIEAFLEMLEDRR